MSEVILKGGTALIDVSDLLKKVDVGPGQVVADLGCGGGGHFVAPTAVTVGSSGLVYAVDIQKKVLNSLEASLKLQNIGNVKLVWSNLEDVGAADIPDNSCDIAFIANVLFQNDQHEAIMREAARIVLPGGKLVVVDWKHYKTPFGPPDERRITSNRVKEIGSTIGLQSIQEFDVGAYHYAVVFMK